MHAQAVEEAGEAAFVTSQCATIPLFVLGVEGKHGAETTGFLRIGMYLHQVS
jgi:hypothetical protein